VARSAQGGEISHPVFAAVVTWDDVVYVKSSAMLFEMLLVAQTTETALGAVSFEDALPNLLPTGLFLA